MGLFSNPQHKPESIMARFRNMPKRKLSEIEKQTIFILVEKSKLQRESTQVILDKGVMVFLAFLVLAYLFKTNNLVPDSVITVLFALGVLVLTVAVFSYSSVMAKEDKILQEVLDNFLR